MSDIEFNIPGGFSLDYDRISKGTSLMSITRMLALQMMRNPYINVGEYMQSLSDIDLDTLILLIDTESVDDNQNLFLISEMLACGEGLTASDDFDTFMGRMNQFIGFLIVESLNRKGLIKVHYENMSFGDDMGDKILAEKK